MSKQTVRKKYDDLNRCIVVLLRLTNEEELKTALEQEFAGLDAVIGVRAQGKILEIASANEQVVVLCFCPDEVHPCSGEAKKIKRVLRMCQNKQILVEKLLSSDDFSNDLEKAKKYCRARFKRN